MKNKILENLTEEEQKIVDKIYENEVFAHILFCVKDLGKELGSAEMAFKAWRAAARKFVETTDEFEAKHKGPQVIFDGVN